MKTQERVSGCEGARVSAKRKTRKSRACLRCGCTQSQACKGGCSWVGNTNICTSCLTTAEGVIHGKLVLQHLEMIRLGDAVEAMRCNHVTVINLFEKLLEEKR